jgi:hypothetical protein
MSGRTIVPWSGGKEVQKGRIWGTKEKIGEDWRTRRRLREDGRRKMIEGGRWRRHVRALRGGREGGEEWNG